MLRGRFWVCLFVFILFVYSNDDREYAIKLANCRRVCVLEYPASSTCSSLCTLHRACSLHSCPLFCGSRDPDTCLDTCQSFTDTLLDTCDEECEAQPRLSVSESEGGIAALDVSLDPLNDTLSHVIILKQINNATGTNLTYDTSLELSVEFRGIYPWFEYEIEVVLMNATSCCVSNNLWNGSVRYDVRGPMADQVTFYPYPLPPTWINTADSGRVANIQLLPDSLDYSASANSWSAPQMRVMSMEDLQVKWGYQNQSSSWKECHDESRHPSVMKCGYQFGMGYLFKESLSADQPIPIHDADTGNPADTRYLAIRPRTTCRYFPNINPTLNLTLELGCGKTNATAGSVTARYSQEKIWIKRCLMSSSSNGKVDRPCCENGSLACVDHADVGLGRRNLTLQVHRTYLFYFLYDPNQVGMSTCSYNKPCDGFYQRITTPQDIAECAPPTHPRSGTLVIVLSVSFAVLVVVMLAGLSYHLWRSRHPGPDLKPPSIPSDMEALLGGELPRDAISKESYRDRGNFGYIFEGKLKVKLNDVDELTKQYEVALKILKSKVEETENVTVTQENIKDAKKAMKAEIHMMKQIQTGRQLNRNILRMYGYVVDAPPYILVLELCATNLTRYLRQIRVQIDNETLSPEDVQIGTTLSLEDHGNSVTREESRTTREITREDSRARLVSQSGQENTLSLLPPRARVLSRSSASNTSDALIWASRGSGYNDSQHGRMIRQLPCMKRFKDTVLTTADLLKFCWQVSYGMEFLHSIDLIHRDLAADNILLKEEENGSLTLKICDFGQSRMLFNGKYVGSGDSVGDRQRMFRLRWTAPEIKQDPKSWSKSSDVWSYGVFMWEVFTLGGQPYPGWPDHHVLDNLLAGLRMKQPPCCHDQAWAIATRCWNTKPELRGEFNGIKDKLDEIMGDEQDKKLGIQRSDYTFCDVPEEDANLPGGEEADVDLMDTDDAVGPLDLDNTMCGFSNLDQEWVVIGNRAAGESEPRQAGNGTAQRINNLTRSRTAVKDLKVSLDVTDEKIKINPENIAQF